MVMIGSLGFGGKFIAVASFSKVELVYNSEMS